MKSAGWRNRSTAWRIGSTNWCRASVACCSTSRTNSDRPSHASPSPPTCCVDPTDAASLAQIELETDRLNQLIGEILQAARLDAAQSQRRFAPLRLDTLLRDVIDACRIEAADGRRIDLDIASPLPTMMEGDGELLRRAVENVLRNALRHAPPKSVLTVRLQRGLGLAGDRDELRLTVRDLGPGVPEAALPHLFLPFYRVDADRERRTGGVGLGLAIARRAIELHGGHISVRNAKPGLEVTIELTGVRQVSESSPDYSARNASTGFTEAARRAGT